MAVYRRIIYLALVLTALGITSSTLLADAARPLGVVLVAVGGLFFIVGMPRKKTADKEEIQSK